MTRTAFGPLKRAPLGGLALRAMAQTLKESGPTTALADLEADLAQLTAHARAPQANSDATLLIVLGGSSGIGRGVVLQHAFVSEQPCLVVHHDSERLQYASFQALAMKQEAQRRGLSQLRIENTDASQPEIVRDLLVWAKSHYSRVHLFHSIAAGSPKRHAHLGATQVLDVDIEFDPLRQVPALTRADAYRGAGLMQVDVASDAECQKTVKLMGQSFELWLRSAHELGLLDGQASVAAFADYDFAEDNPVYACGPLADAKRLQRTIAHQYAALCSTRRVCFPPVLTSAIAAIPGGVLTYILYRAHTLARDPSQKGSGSALQLGAAAARSLFERPPSGIRTDDLRLDGADIASRADLHAQVATLTDDDIRRALAIVATDVLS